jgi:hypothetical protein
MHCFSSNCILSQNNLKFSLIYDIYYGQCYINYVTKLPPKKKKKNPKDFVLSWIHIKVVKG